MPKKEEVSNSLFSPLAVLQQCGSISCHDYEGSHQCPHVEAESFDPASKSSHSLQSSAYEICHQYGSSIIKKIQSGMFIKIILGLTSKNHQCQIQILPRNSSPTLGSTTYINKSKSHTFQIQMTASLYIRTRWMVKLWNQVPLGVHCNIPI